MYLEEAGRRWLKLASNLLADGKEQIINAYEATSAVAEAIGDISRKAVSATRIAMLKAQELDQRYGITSAVKNYVITSAQVALEFLIKECQRLVLAIAEQTAIMQEVRQEIAELRAELAERTLVLQGVMQRLSTLEGRLREEEQTLAEAISLRQQVQFLGKQISELIDLNQTIKPITQNLEQRVVFLENQHQQQTSKPKRSPRKRTTLEKPSDLGELEQ